MPPPQSFDFSGDAVAASYDDVLVPVLFRPWAERLVREQGPWEGQRVLDLAAGTGVVARHLVEHVGSGGHVIAADINADMLAVARERFGSAGVGRVTFVESAAHPLDVESESVDAVVCQQGFQFFPELGAAAGEVHRVLRAGGRAIASCWRDVDRCEFFGAVCDVLRGMGEAGLSDLMRRPFVQDGSELRDGFEEAGFDDVTLAEQDLPLVFDSVETALDAAYATPIGPGLRALSDEARAGFRSALAERIASLSADGRTMGDMVSHVIVARKARPAGA
jgi:SAM-dependent methyltransferase